MAETRQGDSELRRGKSIRLPVRDSNHAEYFIHQGEGEHEGELIHAQLNASGQQSVHRAHFLDELVKSVPSQRTHFNKRVDSLEDKHDGPVVIHFKDGTTATADAVIGADGVHSTVRAHLLGKEAAKPVYAGSVAYRALVPMEKAVEKLGEEFAQNAFFVCGKGDFRSYCQSAGKGAKQALTRRIKRQGIAQLPHRRRDHRERRHL